MFALGAAGVTMADFLLVFERVPSPNRARKMPLVVCFVTVPLYHIHRVARLAGKRNEPVSS